jgi:hypothetical protein
LIGALSPDCSEHPKTSTEIASEFVLLVVAVVAILAVRAWRAAGRATLGTPT